MSAITADAMKVLGVLLEHANPSNLALARELFDTVHKASSGTVTDADVAAALERVREHLASNDAAADEALRLRFQT